MTEFGWLCGCFQDWHPAFGFVNNCDGSRSHSYCDYRQQ
jgi:hypothetical protein